MKKNKQAIGIVNGIYFYNILQNKIVIWYVTYVTCQEQDFFLLFEEIPLILLNNVDKPKVLLQYPEVCELDILILDMRMRLNNPILKLIYSSPSSLWNFTIREDKVLEKIDSIQCSNCIDTYPTYLSGAYMHCEGVMEIESENNLQDKVIQPDSTWTSFMMRNLKVSDIEVHIKTKSGFYSCSSQENTTYKAPKKSKEDMLDILDIFTPLQHLVTIGGTQITLKILTTPFNVLWVNPETKWNCVLPEFFRALYNKVYTNFSGVKPVISYVFPAATSFGTYFQPYFGAFPFVRCQFGLPRKVNPFDISINEEACILLEFWPFKNSTLGDILLIPQMSNLTIIDNHLIESCGEEENNINFWPLWTSEINGRLCQELESKIEGLDLKNFYKKSTHPYKN